MKTTEYREKESIIDFMDVILRNRNQNTNGIHNYHLHQCGWFKWARGFGKTKDFYAKLLNEGHTEVLSWVYELYSFIDAQKAKIKNR